MTAFCEGHSASWLELMQAYQQYRIAVFNWVKEADAVRCKDLMTELTPLFGNERSLERRLLVTNFLRSTDMWDEKTIALVWKELTQVALLEQEEVAGWAAEALLKLKSTQERFCIADEVMFLAEKELQKPEPDYLLFGLGCTLLMRLGCTERFEKFCTRYKDQIYLGIGFDETDLKEMAEQMR